MPIIRQLVTYFILLISVILLSACQPASEKNNSASFIVGVDGNNQDSHYYTDFAIAANSALAGTHIQITEGVYLIDNPIVLEASDVKLSGAGADKTIILAKNANQPIFLLEADGIAIEAVTINALVKNGPGRASFAIQIKDDVEGCNISHTKILNTAAAAIIGHSVSDCAIIGNTILNSGDDAVRLFGDRHTVIDNKIIRYFDEALDLAGSDIVVTGNYVANGRIGIVVADCKNTLVTHNFVENQLQEGIVTGTDPKARISDNLVLNAGRIAFNLYAPQIVTHNQSDGANEVGFRISDMTNGIVYRNITRGNSRGFVFKTVPEKTTSSDGNVGHDGDTETAVGVSKDITIYDNCEQTSLDSIGATCTPYNQEVNLARKVKGQTTVSNHDIFIFDQSVNVQGTTPSDEKRAKKVASLLKFYNPGFTSIHINHTLMKSEITSELYEALKGTGRLGIGLVRAPFLHFSGGKRSFLWYLAVGKKNVAVVSSIYDGPRAKVSFLDDEGELPFLESASLLKDKIFMKLMK